MKKLIQKIVHSKVARIILKQLVAILLIKLGDEVSGSHKIPDNLKPVVKDLITNTTPDIIDTIIDGKDDQAII